jgi:dipeptidyl aminopeptidase/acylaminoacyl peptidase
MRQVSIIAKDGILALLIILFLFLGFPEIAQTSQGKGLSTDDLFRLETIHDVAISPDGESVAYVLQRPKQTAIRFGSDLSGDDNSDIWLVDSNSGRAQDLTNGAEDGAGFWAPKWSPDGKRLAMFSTRGANVRVWIWTKTTQSLKMASERSVDLLSDFRVWISDHELVYPVLPEGEIQELLEHNSDLAKTIAREWSKAESGKEPSVSVLRSGGGMSDPSRSTSQLMMVDVASGATKVLAKGAAFVSGRISPNKQFLAFLVKEGTWRPNQTHSTEAHLVNAIYKLVVADLDNETRTRTVVGTREVFAESLVWSPDSSEIAAIGFAAGPSQEHAQFLRCTLSEWTCRPASTEPLDPDLGLNYADPTKSPLVLYGQPNLLVFAKKAQGVEESKEQQLKWWSIDTQGGVRDFFAGINKAPLQMMSGPGRDGLIGLIDGKIWRINNEGHLLEDLTTSVHSKMTSIDWPRPDSPDPSVKTQLIVGNHTASTSEFFRLDLSTHQLTPLTKPSSEATLVDYYEKSNLAVFTKSDRTGTYLWLGRSGAEKFRKVLETNTFLREIGEGELRKIEYRSEDGEDLNGWVILPMGYQAGNRYPVVVWVYGGLVYTDETPYFSRINAGYPLGGVNLQLLAAHGYAVLLPSMPPRYYNRVRDMYAELPNGVIPALDKLIDDGIADPQRVGIMGWSHGGYSTFGLISQTSRFKAAVAVAGPSDDLSFYGTFSAKLRYQPAVHEDLFRMWQVEDMSAGNPPWQDLRWTFQNSPIFHTDRIQTPLMIIHADLDPVVPIQQGEEMFTALYRQGKRSEFVRYWGEGHDIDSPANVRDLWARVCAWFDEFLTYSETQGGSGTRVSHSPQ